MMYVGLYFTVETLHTRILQSGWFVTTGDSFPRHKYGPEGEGTGRMPDWKNLRPERPLEQEHPTEDPVVDDDHQRVGGLGHVCGLIKNHEQD